MTAFIISPYPWPWAGRPALQWDYIYTNVRCWCTFPVRMDQASTPPAADFSIQYNGTSKTPTAVSWDDEYTLKVVYTPVASQPTKVQLTFTYSDGSLRALTGKQWPSWAKYPCTDIN